MENANGHLTLRQTGYSESVFAYPAWSPSNPRALQYAAICSADVADLRKPGELERMLAKYGAREWNTRKVTGK